MIKKIYFHADDFGRSKVISKNIYKCIKLGIINSVSIMVGFNENYFDKIKKDRYLNIRLHLNLTEYYTKSFLNDIAIGSGLGIRMDLDFFVIRLDVGIPIRNPAIQMNDSDNDFKPWIFQSYKGNEQRFFDYQFNLGIGYPF